MHSKILSTLSIIILCLVANAQDSIPYSDYDDILKKSNKLSDEGKYNEAYETLSTVNKNDSNYIYAIISRSYFLLNNEDKDPEKYDEAIKLTQEGIDAPYLQSKYYYYNNQSAAYIQKKMYKEAITTYDEALKIYPKNYKLIYNKGVVYEMMEEYDKAIEMYKQSLIYNPYYAECHLKLGNLCYQSKNISEALMCLDVYLLLNPDGDASYKILQALNNIVSAKADLEEELDITISKDDKSFEEINLYINNLVALNKKYKIDNKINIAVTNQTHLMLEQLKTYEGNDGFFSRKYVPFYNWLRESKEFNNFVYTICFSSKNENHKKIINSNMKEIKAFIPSAYKKLGDCFKNNNMMNFNGKDQMVSCYYYNYALQGLGSYKEDKMTGYWEIYSTEYGYLLSKGMLDDNEQKTGEWSWFYENGALQEKTNFKEGKPDGLYEYYFDNGNLEYSKNYVDGELEGEFKAYNKSGALIEQKFFSKGKLEGTYKSFYAVGEDYPEYIIPYKDGEINGMVTQYYLNGQKNLEANFIDGKKEGLEKKFYANGKISSEIEYKEGKYNGSYKTYFPNGQIESEGQTENGQSTGKWKSYFLNGTVESEYSYEKGQIVGEYKEYDVDGKLHLIYDYKKNDVYGYSFFDKDGKLIHSDDKQSGKLNYKGFYPNGNIKNEGLYNYNGGKEGEWKYYDVNGVLNSTSEFKENMLTDKSLFYFPDGSVEIIKNYKKDTIDGYYLKNYRSGTKYNQGWYKNGNLHGVWEIYYPNKKLKEKSYYNNDKLNGEDIDYCIDGKVTVKSYYRAGELLTTELYNKQGEAYDKIVIPEGKNDTLYTYHPNKAVKVKYNYSYGNKNGKFTEYYPNGKKRVEGAYINNYRDGKWKWYHQNGQVEIECNYVLDDMDGERKEYYENGQLKEQQNYILGNLNGEEKDYNEKGILTAVINYYDNNFHGKRYFYSEDGHLQLIRFYDQGTIIGYSYLDKDKKELPMIPIKNETAKITAYFDNGKKSRVMEIDKGEFVNDYLEYYYTGEIYQEQFYKQDDLEGDMKTYYKNGNLQSIKHYENGLVNGKVTEYYENKAVKEETDYTYNIKNGKSIHYSNDGKIIREEEYFDDEIIMIK